MTAGREGGEKGTRKGMSESREKREKIRSVRNTERKLRNKTMGGNRDDGRDGGDKEREAALRREIRRVTKLI